MTINKDSLKERTNNLSKKLNISQNVIYNRFFFGAFIYQTLTHRIEQIFDL